MLRVEVKGQSAFHLAAASVFSLFVVMMPPPTLPPPTGPHWFIRLKSLWVSSANTTTSITSDLTIWWGGSTLLLPPRAGNPQSKEEKKKKLSPCTKDFFFEKTWFSRFIRCNKHDFILLALLIEMSCLFHKLETFYPPEPTLHQPTTDGIWWELAARPWCTPHISYNLLAPSTKAPAKISMNFDFPPKRKPKYRTNSSPLNQHLHRHNVALFL